MASLIKLPDAEGTKNSNSVQSLTEKLRADNNF